MGSVYDQQRERFYVSYLDSINPGSANVRLGVFDGDWELLSDIPVTYHEDKSLVTGGRPWIILLDSALYVSYDVGTHDHQTFEENKDWKCVVAKYDISD